jgi:hypothetical protein
VKMVISEAPLEAQEEAEDWDEDEAGEILG